MIKKFLCRLWGHKTVHKAFTGETIDCIGVLGNVYTQSLYKFQKTDYCIRCGTPTKEEPVCLKK